MPKKIATSLLILPAAITIAELSNCECFGIAGFMRLVITIPAELIQEACNRMSEFCSRYYT